jgi:hypothetical protein
VIGLGARKSVGWVSTNEWLAIALDEATPMPEIIETTVYRLDELSDAASPPARQK